MKLYIFPLSGRALGIVALKNYLALDCEVQPIDLGRGDQLTPQYLALNPNKFGAPDPAFIARGEQNFIRFAAVVNDSLKGRAWLIGERLTIADFSVGGLVPSAERMGLPVGDFPEIVRWYKGLAALPAWREALAAKDAATAAWQSKIAS